MRFVERVLNRLGFYREPEWRRTATKFFRQSDPDWAIAKMPTSGHELEDPYRQHAWVFACISAISNNVAQVPVRVYTGTSTQNARELETGPIYNIFHRPNAFWSGADLMLATAAWLQSCGNALWILKRETPRADPAEILCVGRDGWRCELGADNRVIRYGYRPAGEQKEIFLAPHQVIHFRLWNPNDAIWGHGPLQAAHAAADQDYAAETYNSAFFTNSGVPAAAIEYPADQVVTNEDWSRFKERWHSMYGGVRNAFRLAALTGGAKYVPIGPSHKDMLFVEQRKWNREMILACFKVPPSEVGVFEHVHKAAGDSIDRAFWEKTLLPIMGKIEETLRAQFFLPYDGERTWIEFDRDSIGALQENADTKVDRASKLFVMGVPFNLIDEVVGLGIGTIPGGDVGYRQMSMVPNDAPPMLFGPSGGNGDGDGKTIPLPAAAMTKLLQQPAAAAAAPVAECTRDAPVYSPAQIERWKAWVRGLQPLERRVGERMRSYFSRVRKYLLSALAAAPGHAAADIPDSLLALSAKWDDELRTLMAQHYKRITDTVGGTIESHLAGAGIDFTFNADDPRIRDFLAVKEIKITRINEKIQEQVRAELIESQTQHETVGELQERIFGVMQDARSRSLLIARTETASAANGVEYQSYQIAGVKQHQWLAALDEHTRDSHIAAMAQGPIPFGSRFNNGLFFPGDPNGEPGEVCNCRCALMVIE